MGCNLIHCKFARMTIEELNRLLLVSLTERYDEREAASITSLVMDRITGIPKGLRLLQKKEMLSAEKLALFQRFLEELMGNRPVQYVLGEAWFGGLSFFVDESVLIPRPETEELANWLLDVSSARPGGLSLLDIGTGSGCIAIYIHTVRNDIDLMALDVSEAALKIAKKNAAYYNAEIEFFCCDICDTRLWEKIPLVDMIVSNPPYIPVKQRPFLDKHVKDFEPAIALFVPDDDPILFYKIIGELALRKLKPRGELFLEIHHDFALEVIGWYKKNGYSIEIRKDFSGNNRMIKACRLADT
jgi:release factor glutamine methyltransferase